MTAMGNTYDEFWKNWPKSGPPTSWRGPHHVLSPDPEFVLLCADAERRCLTVGLGVTSGKPLGECREGAPRAEADHDRLPGRCACRVGCVLERRVAAGCRRSSPRAVGVVGMNVETDFSPGAIARRSKLRQMQLAADGMLKRAVHMEKRAARTGVASNAREKLIARARHLRACEQLLRVEITALAADGSKRSEDRAEKLMDAGRRQAVRHG